MPATTAARAPVSARARANFGSPHASKWSFSSGATPSSAKRSRRGLTVGPRPFLYCSVARTGTPSAFAACNKTSVFLTSWAIASAGIALASRS